MTKDQEICGVCLTKFSECRDQKRRVRVLPCGHSFCHVCIEAGQITACPYDRTNFDQDANKNSFNFLAESLLDQNSQSHPRKKRGGRNKNSAQIMREKRRKFERFRRYGTLDCKIRWKP